VRSGPIVLPLQPLVSLASLLVPLPPGAAAPAPAALAAAAAAAAAGGGGPSSVYIVTLAGPQGPACRPGPHPHEFTWTILEAPAPGAPGAPRPVTDLRLMLGAPMHLVVVSADLAYAGHSHGAAAGAPGGAAAPGGCGGPPSGGCFGPAVRAPVVLPRRGAYALVAQLQRGEGELLRLPFYVDCTGPEQLRD
jgi:hypothetical protein